MVILEGNWGVMKIPMLKTTADVIILDAHVTV